MDWFTHYEATLRRFGQVEDRANAHDYLAACRALGNAAESSGEMGIALAQNALDQGVTKKAICIALGISEGSLRGMHKKGHDPKRKGDGLDHLRELLP
jgi:hypothetical protein